MIGIGRLTLDNLQNMVVLEQRWLYKSFIAEGSVRQEPVSLALEGKELHFWGENANSRTTLPLIYCSRPVWYLQPPSRLRALAQNHDNHYIDNDTDTISKVLQVNNLIYSSQQPCYVSITFSVVEVGIGDEKLRNLTKTIYRVKGWGRIQTWNTLTLKSGCSWLCYLDSKPLNSERRSLRSLSPELWPRWVKYNCPW